MTSGARRSSRPSAEPATTICSRPSRRELRRRGFSEAELDRLFVEKPARVPHLGRGRARLEASDERGLTAQPAPQPCAAARARLLGRGAPRAHARLDGDVGLVIVVGLCVCAIFAPAHRALRSGLPASRGAHARGRAARPGTAGSSSAPTRSGATSSRGSCYGARVSLAVGIGANLLAALIGDRDRRHRRDGRRPRCRRPDARRRRRALVPDSAARDRAPRGHGAEPADDPRHRRRQLRRLPRPASCSRQVVSLREREFVLAARTAGVRSAVDPPPPHRPARDAERARLRRRSAWRRRSSSRRRSPTSASASSRPTRPGET